MIDNDTVYYRPHIHIYPVAPAPGYSYQNRYQPSPRFHSLSLPTLQQLIPLLPPPPPLHHLPMHLLRHLLIPLPLLLGLPPILDRLHPSISLRRLLLLHLPLHRFGGLLGLEQGHPPRVAGLARGRPESGLERMPVLAWGIAG